MNVEFRQRFEKDLENIADPKVLTRLESALEEVRKAKSQGAVHNLNKLSGKPGYYRIRVGDYRIGFKLVAGTAIFLRCLHRKDIYRHFP